MNCIHASHLKMLLISEDDCPWCKAFFYEAELRLVLDSLGVDGHKEIRHSIYKTLGKFGSVAKAGDA